MQALLTVQPHSVEAPPPDQLRSCQGCMPSARHSGDTGPYPRADEAYLIRSVHDSDGATVH